MALISKIDPEEVASRLAPWLAEKLSEGDAPATDVRVSEVVLPHASGMSSETVLFDISWREHDQEQYQRAAMRVAPAGAGLFMTYDLDQEAAVMQLLQGAPGVPVPRVLVRESDPALFGAPFFVMERVDGQVPGDDPPFTVGGWVMELEPSQRAALYDNGLRALAAVHDAGATAPPSAVGAGSGDAALDDHLAYWMKFFGWASGGRPNPTIEAGLQWLSDNQPADAGPSVLLWGDARLGNLVFDDDQAVTGVLDWEMASEGPRELDLAWWLFLMRHHTEGIGVPVPDGIPSADESVRRYQELTGHTAMHLEYFEVFAAVRLAILVLRAAHLLIEVGALPPDATMGIVNPATTLMAQLLGLPHPQGDGSYYIGNR